MTNTEYEAASIAAAGCYDKFEGEHKLKQCDKAIAVLEESLARLQVERREIVNRYSLNKDCTHFAPIDDSGRAVCIICKKCISGCKDDDAHAHMVD